MNTVTPTAEQKNDTIFGGRSATVTFEDGATAETVRVEQLRVRQYEAAFKLLDNEFALVGLMCGRDEVWAKSLSPASYEDVYALTQEVNQRGFFTYAARTHAGLVKRLNDLSPQILNAATAAATSSASSQRPRPRQA